MTPYSFESFRDNNNIPTLSLENFGGYPLDHQHQSFLLDDINQCLLEFPLQQPDSGPEPEPNPNPNPNPEYHHLDAPYTKQYDLFQQGYYGPTPIPTLSQGYQTLQQGPEIKKVDEAIDDSREKQAIQLEPDEPADNPHHLQDSLTRRAQRRSSENKRRRERINAKMRTIQELIPHCPKGNYATILEHAIQYIKSLKLYIDAVSRLRMEQGQFQGPYAAQMMAQPWPRMFHGVGSGPWAWGPQLTQIGYPTLEPIHGLGGFGGGLSHAQAPSPPMLCRSPYLTTPIMSPPTPVVLPLAPPQSQSTPPSSFNQAPHF